MHKMILTRRHNRRSFLISKRFSGPALGALSSTGMEQGFQSSGRMRKPSNFS